MTPAAGLEHEVVEFDMGTAGCGYLHDTFSQGLTLAKRVLERTDLSAGRVTTWAPSNTPASRLLSWDEGGLVPASLVTKMVVDTITLQMPTITNAVMVAENALAHCSDPIVRQAPVGRFCYGEEVYEYTTALGGRGEVNKALRRADADFSLNAVVASRTASGPVGRAPGLDFLEELASGVCLLLARAYDGEGFVVWRRRNSSAKGT